MCKHKWEREDEDLFDYGDGYTHTYSCARCGDVRSMDSADVEDDDA